MRAPWFPLAVCLAVAPAWTACGSSDLDTDSCSGGKCDRTQDAGPTPAPSFCEDRAGQLPPEWISGGPECGREPLIQVHRYDDDTFILRQSLCTSGEAPFLYLLFGDEKVLMEDTGDNRGVPIELAETVGAIIDGWLAENSKTDIELVVVNSHAHGDHVGHNEEMRSIGTVVGFDRAEVSAFFGIANWPDDSAEIDLGGRVVDLLPIPGHERSHIALYDRRDGLLLTGDTFYPGRLFIRDFDAYKDSIDKLLEFTENRPVCHVLGTHIEMTRTPGEQYDFDVDHHPNEHPLELTRDHLLELDDALDAMGSTAKQEVHDDFIVFPL